MPTRACSASGLLVTDRGDNMLKAFYEAIGEPMWTFTAGGAVNHHCRVSTAGLCAIAVCQSQSTSLEKGPE